MMSLSFLTITVKEASLVLLRVETGEGNERFEARESCRVGIAEPGSRGLLGDRQGLGYVMSYKES